MARSTANFVSVRETARSRVGAQWVAGGGPHVARQIQGGRPRPSSEPSARIMGARFVSPGKFGGEGTSTGVLHGPAGPGAQLMYVRSGGRKVHLGARSTEA